MNFDMVWKNVWDLLSFPFQHLLVINCLLSIVIIFFQRKNPASVWTWLLILYFIPVAGFVFYLLIGGDMHKSRMFRTKELEDHIHEAIRSQEASIRTRTLQEEWPHLKKYSDLIYYNLESAGTMLTDNNRIRIFTDGNEKFGALIEDMKQAREFIHIQYYIIKNDVLFQRISDVLVEKAKEGVEIRILCDGMGGRFVSRRFWQKLRDCGIHTAVFFPPLLGPLNLRINYRNHRKIAVIDGCVGYVGGFNVGKEYVGLDDRFGYWRDTHLRIEGAAVANLHVRFILDWNYASRDSLPDEEERYFWQPEERLGKSQIQIISSGPDSNLQNVRNNYLRLINKAEKSIYIQTPYFIPDDAIFSALVVAAYSGVEVNIMIPCKPDHPFVYWATYSYIGDLVMAGAKCYTYDNGFLHAKGLIVDEQVLCYGTANMDIRSFKLNFEVNAVVYDEKEAVKMVEAFQKDLEVCTCITRDLYASRGLIVRFKEQVCRLLSPLL